MSDTSRRRAAERAAQRRKAALQRGQRVDAAQPRGGGATAVTGVAAVGSAGAVTAARSRRTASRSAFRPVAISREAELAYIRADMRRLLIIAGTMLVLMLVILMIVER